MTQILSSYIEGKWHAASGGFAEIHSAIDNSLVAKASSAGVDFGSVVAHARKAGAALRKLTFQQRADLLKKLAVVIGARKEELYAASFNTGSTRNDAAVDIEGGLGTLFVYASKGKRELPNETFIIDGDVEILGKTGQFGGRHIYTPLQGVALHINAFNFPVWGTLEKFAPAFLAGMPVISKPATVTSYVTELMMRIIVESKVLPEGSLQLIVGATGDIFDHLGSQDVVAFTGSADTSEKLQRHKNIAKHSIRFNAERDSLNAAILCPDANPASPEFDLFIKEITREMTVKAGQKCTAIRRIIAPNKHVEAVIEALKSRLSMIKIGDPRNETTRMGALVGLSQRTDALAKLALLSKENALVFGDMQNLDPNGAYLSPHLMYCKDGMKASKVHEVEAFAPVATVIGYDDLEEGIAIVQKGDGSLVASAYTYDLPTASKLIAGFASYHGRLLFLDRDCAKESTGHGSPMPHLIHGGPGRAGGGEELGGLRAVYHHCQKTAIQGSPRLLSSVTKSWIKGAPVIEKEEHPFQVKFNALELGQTFNSKVRQITTADVEHFAEFTGDTFFAHMDEKAVEGHPFFKGRVAHGYLMLSFAAGLFVDKEKGAVLANYGLNNLRFTRPLLLNESIQVRLTVKEKAPSKPEYGEVKWDVEITTLDGETCAVYELLTMNAI